MEAKIIDDGKTKLFLSENYNYKFNRTNGFFARWGKTMEDDPDWSAFGPEILDLEISAFEPDKNGTEFCSGKCSFCYKGNNKPGKLHNMSLNEFKEILSKMPPTLTQIAFGICDVDDNKDFIPMMEHALYKGIIPNFTCNGKNVNDQFASIVSQLCGACAVSIVNKQKSYDAIKKFTDAGMDQVNIHYMLSEESYDQAFKIIDDIKSDSRLKKMNAIVFLQYKHKNLTSPFHSMLDKSKYRKLVQYCEDNEVAFGFDSCSANLFIESVQDMDKFEMYQMVSEPCESTLMSSYIDCHGNFYPCSFCENIVFEDQNWSEGLNVLQAKTFMDIWNDPKVDKFRKRLLKGCRNCPVYKI